MKAITVAVAAKRISAIFVLLGLLMPAGIGAQCNTPPITLDDATTAFDEPVLIDVLANDSDDGGQALAIAVDGTTCSGSATVDFELVTLTPAPRLTEDCTISYTATDEGGLSSSAMVQVTIVAGIFADGFESGDTSAWSM